MTGFALVIGLAAALVVNPDFERFHVVLNLERPADWAGDLSLVTASPIAPRAWTPPQPLQVDFSRPIEPGDVVKIKLNGDHGRRRLDIEVGGAVVATEDLDGRWREFELPVVVGGPALELRLDDGGAVPVHIARLSLTNVEGFVGGPFPAFIVSTIRPRPESGRLWWFLFGVGLAMVVGVAVDWGERRASRRDDRVWSVVAALMPGTVLVVIAAALPVVGAARLVLYPQALALLVGGPALAVQLCRYRREIDAGLRNRIGRWWRVRPQEAEDPEPIAITSRIVVTAMIVTLLLSVAAAVWIVRDFGGPMLGNGDLNLWVHQSDYVRTHLHLNPLPTLELQNDDLLYPYGTNQVFMPWVFEAHLLSAGLTSLFGLGPWEQLYFVLSLAITVLGSFLLLVPDHGVRRAAVAAFAVSFGNAYAMCKFPGHFGLSCYHWMTLALLADGLLVWRRAHGRPWSATLVAARVAFAFLGLGLDLGYVAGINLTSGVVTAIWLAVLDLREARRRQISVIGRAVEISRDLRGSFLRHRVRVVVLIVLVLAAATVYVPLAADIATAARSYDFSDVPGGVWWANPVRLLLPIVPGSYHLAREYLVDKPEARFAMQPGLSLVLAAIAGLIWGRRRVWFPSLIVLLLFLSYHPESFRTLNLLPWFSFARVSSRFSIALPALLVTCALAVPRWRTATRVGRIVVWLLIALGTVEVVTAYRGGVLVGRWRFWHPGPAASDMFKAVRNAPGEAVFEWPFCVAAGNGLGPEWTTTYYHQLSGTSVLQAFHHKKTVGMYYGRLHPSQVEPFLDAGWPRLFVPRTDARGRPVAQLRDPAPHEWRFLEDFIRLNDFCGVILYADLLPQTTIDGFVARMGPTVARAEATPFGTMLFLRVPEEWRAATDLDAGRRLVLERHPPPWPLSTTLELSKLEWSDLLGSGWLAATADGRATEGPVAEIEFSLAQPRDMTLVVSVRPFLDQRVRLVVNGQPVAETSLEKGGFRERRVRLSRTWLQRDNLIRLELPDARSPASLGLNPKDHRELGITMAWMRLEP